MCLILGILLQKVLDWCQRQPQINWSYTINLPAIASKIQEMLASSAVDCLQATGSMWKRCTMRLEAQPKRMLQKFRASRKRTPQHLIVP